MAYEFYVTPTELEIALKNGISRKRLDDRIQNLAWDKERAITTPPKQYKSTDKKWRELARKNGIPYRCFQKRVIVYGWNQERAATEPLQDRREHIIKVMEARDKAIEERKMVRV